MSTAYTLTGKGASPGIAIGPALIYRSSLTQDASPTPTQVKSRYRSGTAHSEIAHLEAAIGAADASMTEAAQKLQQEGKAAESQIFEAHRAILNDHTLYERATTLITKASWRAADAILEAGEQHIAPMTNTDDPYFIAYAAEIRDVVRQVYRILVHGTALAERLTEPAIIVADDLGLSEWMNISRERLLGFALSSGGPTSHSIIMARSLSIPTITGLSSAELNKLPNNATLALDGTTGELFVMPDEPAIATMHARAECLATQEAEFRTQRDLPCVTSDGQRVLLFANAATTIEAQTAREWRAEGIGSLRTELLFLGRTTLPNEEEQLALYTAIAQELPGCPIVARTLDIGGDKYLPAFPLPSERNPFLGWRGIRIGLSQPEEILLPQLRAMLRAGAEADVRIVLPMIATVSEFRQAKALLQQAHEELQQAAMPCAAEPKLGVMVEIPAAAIAADILAREADFLSIGTNDLIQYTLACDRTNERIAMLYQPLEPAVLRLIHSTTEAAHRYGRTASVCGEMASDPAIVPLLIGMGVDELSCTPAALPRIRAAVRATHAASARELAQAACAATSLEEVVTLMQ